MNYIAIARWLPPKLGEWMRKSLVYADIDVNPEKLLGFLSVFGLSLSLALAADLYLFFGFNPLLGFCGSLAGFSLLFYLFLFFMIESRSRFIENVLPDALQLMSSNIRVGMTTDRAFLLSARPEFGPLEKEIRRVGKKIFSGGEIDKELLAMAKRIRSNVFDRTISIIVEGIRSGGELDRILVQTAHDLRRQESVRKEIEATILMYSVLVFMGVGFAAPFLFGVSSYLAEVLGERMASFGFVRGLTQTLNLEAGGASFSPQSIVVFSVSSLTMSSVFGSLLIGLIQEGNEKVGAKYIPVFLTLSITLFFLTRKVMVSFFGQLLT